MGMGGSVTQVPLGQVATIKQTAGPMVVRTEDAVLTAWVYVDVAGRDIGGYVAEARAMLAGAKTVLEQLSDWTVPAIDAAIRAFAEARSLKLGKVAQPLRAALTGRTVSPGIFEVMVLIGKAESLARIGDQAIA